MSKQKSPILGPFMRVLKFSFMNMVRADIFIRFFGSFLIQNCDSLFPIRFFRVLATAAEGGEMSSDYFQDTQHSRISQCLAPPTAGLGDQIVRRIVLKNQLAILKSGIKENFNKN